MPARVDSNYFRALPRLCLKYFLAFTELVSPCARWPLVAESGCVCDARALVLWCTDSASVADSAAVDVSREKECTTVFCVSLETLSATLKLS